ncbi:MAG TPA: ACT domain-containing protein [Firmicutes bacterium]|nr:ACT domain-containing protein [Bacillota bacterium]
MTKDELSIVTLQAQVPKGIKCDPFWNILMVIGPLDFSLVGVLADISKVLKAAEISIFVISTYETDYILVKKDNLQKAITVLNNSGYEVLC